MAGRVSVNGVVVRILGSKADPSTDTVSVDGKPVQSGSARRYLALHKPKGCITSTSDPQGRRTVMDLLGPAASRGLFPVGRLDYNTEGLLLLTDDGDFANRILAARNKVPKTYEVKINGSPPWEAIEKLRKGVRLDGRLSKPVSIRLARPARNPWYEITLVEGRNRQIHRMFERIGFLVEKIRRVSIGCITLRGLEPRQVRELHRREIEDLLAGKPPSGAQAEFTRRRRPARQRRPPSRRSSGGRYRGRQGRQRRDSGRGRAEGSARSGGRGGQFRRSGKPPRRPAQRRPSGDRSPARAGTTGRKASRGRKPPMSRGRRSSHRGSRARP